MICIEDTDLNFIESLVFIVHYLHINKTDSELNSATKSAKSQQIKYLDPSHAVRSSVHALTPHP